MHFKHVNGWEPIAVSHDGSYYFTFRANAQ